MNASVLRTVTLYRKQQLALQPSTDGLIIAVPYLYTLWALSNALN